MASKFVWFEHVSKDPAKAQGFLGELFGWTTQTMQSPDGKGYTMIALGKDPIGGYPPMPAPHAHWLSHLLTADTKALAAKIKSAGGKVLVEPTEMGGMGVYALVSDPLGGAFALWQPLKHEPNAGEWKNVTGAFCWNELMTEQPEKSVEFYTKIGGFEVEKMEMGMGTYYVLKTEGKPRGGIMKAPMPGIPQSWLPYVQVASTDATHDKAKRLGADIKAPPMDIPTVGRFSIFTDPQGAALGILQPAR